MGNPQPPGLDISEADCPHCGQRREFKSYSLYRDRRDRRDGSKPPKSAGDSDALPIDPLVHRRGNIDQPCAAQICESCGGLLFYVGAQYVYPPTQISAAPFTYVPDGLNASIRAAIQFRSSASPYAAALLRRALVELCRRAGMPDSDAGAYVQFLLSHPKISSTLRDKVIEHCFRPYGQPAEADRIYDHDNEMRVFGLEDLIDGVATALQVGMRPER